MIKFPNAKINIGLNVIEKRPDGFHNIESIFYPIQLHDSLEIIEKSGHGEISFQSSGIEIPESNSGNLCIQVYRLLNDKFDLPSIDCHLLKAIPIGAGLGGGSSDGAFMMKMLNDYFELNLSDSEMNGHIKPIGSDCPFFISNSPSYVSGLGQIMENIDLDLDNCGLIVVNPGIHIPTQDAYNGIKPKKSDFDLRKISSLNRNKWKNFVKNDFETTIIPKHPKINMIKEKLYSKGAFYASMSGSGSSVFGIFNSDETPEIDLEGCKIWKGKL